MAGDKAVCKSSPPTASELKAIGLDQEPYCLAVGNAEHAFPGRLYVGMRDHVEVYDARRLAAGRVDRSRRPHSRWPRPKRTCLSPMPARWSSGDTIRPAKCSADRPARPIAGTPAGSSVPVRISHVAVAPDGLLRVANPGAHRVEAYTLDGHLRAFLGQGRQRHREFCGCCGPSNIAVLPDGRVVTAEKGHSAGEGLQHRGRVRVRGGRAGHACAQTFGRHRNLRRAHAAAGGPGRRQPAGASWCSIRRPRCCADF